MTDNLGNIVKIKEIRAKQRPDQQEILSRKDFYLDKFGAVARQAAFEPQKWDNVTNTVVLLNDSGHGNSCISWLLTCTSMDIIGNKYTWSSLKVRELDAVYDKLWTATSNSDLNIGSQESNFRYTARLEFTVCMRSISGLCTSIITDSRNNMCWRPHFPTLDGNIEVFRNCGRDGVLHWRNNFLLHLELHESLNT